MVKKKDILSQVSDSLKTGKELTPEQVEEFKIATMKAISANTQQAVEGRSKDFEQIVNQVIEENIKEGTISSAEDLELTSKVLSKMLVAEINGEDPDFGDLQPLPCAEVVNAIGQLLATEIFKSEDDIVARISNLSRLFGSNYARPLKENHGYRLMVKPLVGGFSNYQKALDVSLVFKDHRNYNGAFDIDVVDKLIRQLDNEIRQLSPLEREEFSFNFMETIITKDTDGFRGWFPSYEDNIDSLSTDSRKTFGSIIQFYFVVKEYSRIIRDGGIYIRRQLKSEDGRALKDIVNQAFDKPEVEIDLSRASPTRTTLYEDEYKLILGLNRALLLALPNTFADTIKVAIKIYANTKYDIDFGKAYELDELSRNLRHAFIALTQGRGSFESFFKAIKAMYDAMQGRLEETIGVTRMLVNLYDSLGLNIKEILEKSKGRITFDLPF